MTRDEVEERLDEYSAYKAVQEAHDDKEILLNKDEEGRGIFVDDNGALVTYPPEHKIDGGFAVRLRKNG